MATRAVAVLTSGAPRSAGRRKLIIGSSRNSHWHATALTRRHLTPSRTVAWCGATVAGCYATSSWYSNFCSIKSTSTLVGQHGKVNESSEQPLLLACSSATTHDNEGRAFVNQLLERISHWIKYLWDFLVVGTRSVEVALRLSPLLLLTPAAMLSAQLITLEGDDKSFVSDIAWNYTIYAVQSLGPVAVKLCQWIATRRDIFPPHICDRLGQLHDAGSPHAWRHTQETLYECFGQFSANGLKVEEIIGCGSAAQVYRGSLTEADGNREGKERRRLVAIKVLHPKFQELVDRDFAFIQAAADLLHTLPSNQIRMLNLPRVAKNFGAVLRLQADLNVEAQNLRQFRSNFYRDKTEEEASSIIFPEPVEGWTSSKAIVEEYVGDATPISEYLKDSSEAGLQIRKELAGPLLRSFLKMVFMDNFVHGDLHPGNVMVVSKTIAERPLSKRFWSDWITPSKSSHKDDHPQEVKRSIVFLDAGISNSLSPVDQQNLHDLFYAVIFNDGFRAGQLMVERAKYERCSQVEGGVEKFAKGVEDIVSEFHDRRKEGLTLGAVRIGSLLTRVLDLCRIHGVEIDPAMTNVVLSTLVLEGLGRSLEPNLNLIDFAKPFILGLGRV